MSKIYQTAIKLLARREHSIQELNHKLKAKKFNPDEIKIVLDFLEQKKLVSDERFGEVYVRSRSQKGFGKMRIEAELKERGLPSSLIKTILEKYFVADIRKVYEKKFGTFNFEQFKQLEMKEKAKRMRYLQNKGFSQQDIHQLFNKMLDEVSLQNRVNNYDYQH